MPHFHDLHKHRLWPAIVWALRITVALQCLGNWRWMTQLQETPLLHWMLDPRDIGGLAWSEPTAFAVQQSVGWAVLAAGMVTLWRAHAVVLVPLTLLQALIAIAMWQTADGFPLRADWLPAGAMTLFPFATQAMRIAAPAGLAMLSLRGSISLEPVTQIFRGAAAIVFFAHGLEALQHNPVFIDLILNTDGRLLHLNLSQAAAEKCLTAIGIVDVTLAVACLCRRWPGVLVWMAIWGGLTAVSRITANGWGPGLHEFLTRAPHFGVPLAVALGWHLLKWKATSDVDPDPIQPDSAGI